MPETFNPRSAQSVWPAALLRSGDLRGFATFGQHPCQAVLADGAPPPSPALWLAMSVGGAEMTDDLGVGHGCSDFDHGSMKNPHERDAKYRAIVEFSGGFDRAAVRRLPGLFSARDAENSRSLRAFCCAWLLLENPSEIFVAHAIDGDVATLARGHAFARPLGRIGGVVPALCHRSAELASSSERPLLHLLPHGHQPLRFGGAASRAVACCFQASRSARTSSRASRSRASIASATSARAVSAVSFSCSSTVATCAECTLEGPSPLTHAKKLSCVIFQ